jgi:hypothetical protein
VIGREDLPVGRTIQAGFASGAQTHTVFGRNEPAMIHYHRALRAALGLDQAGLQAWPRVPLSGRRVDDVSASRNGAAEVN